MDVVDIRRMNANPPPAQPAPGPTAGVPPPNAPLSAFPPLLYMMMNHFAGACELVHRFILEPMLAARRALKLDNRALRMAAVGLVIDRSRHCYELIRGLHQQFGFDRHARYGQWSDILVLIKELQGRKRPIARGEAEEIVAGDEDMAELEE